MPTPIAVRRLLSGERATFEVKSSELRPWHLPGPNYVGYDAALAGTITYRDDNGVARETRFFRPYNPGRYRFLPPVAEDENEYSD
jgi:hypothetical protein